MSNKLSVLSCIQPTSEIHIGNYFGAVENWVRLQESNEFQCIFGVVDLHAMTMPFKPLQLHEQTLEMIMDLLACGINPINSTIFIQSLVPEHAELNWILSCICSYGELLRMTQFKEKSAQLKESVSDEEELLNSNQKSVSSGLFTYPVLQASDILVYRAKYVPVGKDQVQHLELTRSLARRFNSRFGELFPVPKVLLTETPKIMSLADPEKKMSKSLGEKHFIGLFEDEENILNKIKSAVTDSGPITEDVMSPGVLNLLSILKACGKENEAYSLKKDYETKSLKYVTLKEAVSDAVINFTNTLKTKRKEIMHDKENLKKTIYRMSDNAREIASETIREVRLKVGLLPKQ